MLVKEVEQMSYLRAQITEELYLKKNTLKLTYIQILER